MVGSRSSHEQKPMDGLLDSFYKKKSIPQKVQFVNSLKEERIRIPDDAISVLENLLFRIMDEELNTIDNEIKLMGSDFPLWSAFLEREREDLLDVKIEALNERDTMELSPKIDNNKRKGMELANDNSIRSAKKEGIQSSTSMTMWKVPETKNSTEAADHGYVRNVNGKEQAQQDVDYLLKSGKSKKLKTSGSSLNMIEKAADPEASKNDKQKELAMTVKGGCLFLLCKDTPTPTSESRDEGREKPASDE